jgi:CRISPR-associated protein Csx10
VFDPQGIPYLPARRCKGLLRDSYRELRDCAELGGLPEEPDLFGETGQHNPGWLVLDNASLEAASEIAEWIRSMHAGLPDTFTRQEVMAQFTSVCRQTKVDRKYGRAEDETLRVTRTLKAGQVFYAPIHLRGEERKWSHRASLALAAANVKAMGVSRHRGFGEVRCSLEELVSPGKWESLTADAIRWADQAVERAVPSGTTQTAMPHAPDASAAEGPSENNVLRYRVRLLAPALFPSMGGDPFTVSSRDYVPGSVIRGVFAAAYLQVGGSAESEEFGRCFCGEVTFGPAAPALDGKEPLGPVPHSLRKYKRLDRFVDFARSSIEDNEQVERESGWLQWDCLHEGVSSKRVKVERELHYHHARPADRRIQRAVGVEEDGYGHLTKTERGALFTYESIQAGQVFSGEIRGDEASLAKLAKLVSTGTRVELGRSRTAQYGGRAVWNWLPASGRSTRGSTQESCDTIVAVLRSPLIAVNERGHPEPCFPRDELRSRLGVENLDIEKSFVRTEWTGTFLSHLRIPRQQMPALAAGSVFVIRVAGDCPPAKLEKAAQFSYGLMTEDGYGQLALWEYTDTDLAGFALDPGKALPRPPSGQSAKVRAFAVALLQEQVRELAIARALGHASDAIISSAPPAHLLARLTAMLTSGTLASFAQKLGQLRDTAKRHLEKTKVQIDQDRMTLEEMLKRPPGELFNRLADLTYITSAGWRHQFAQDDPFLNAGGPARDVSFAEEIARLYLIQFLR